MYRQFYGLTAEPFSLNPELGPVYPGVRYVTASTILDYAALRGEGIVAVTGEVGCGKTTLIRHFLNTSAANRCVGVISNPSMLKETLMTGTLLAFHQQVTASQGALLYAGFHAFLDAQLATGRSPLLIVDEAQSLSVEVLEELRLLTNPEIDGGAMLQLVLVGQPGLQQMLYRPDLSQLLQRVVAHCHLESLSEDETSDYVAHRLAWAGCRRAIFTPSAVTNIHQGADGIPRLINMICDRALLYGYSEGLQQIDGDVIAQVISDRGLGGFAPTADMTDASAPLTATGMATATPIAIDNEAPRKAFGIGKQRV